MNLKEERQPLSSGYVPCSREAAGLRMKSTIHRKEGMKVEERVLVLLVVLLWIAPKTESRSTNLTTLDSGNLWDIHEESAVIQVVTKQSLEHLNLILFSV